VTLKEAQVGNMPQSEHTGTTSSGTSDVPDILAYPKILKLHEIPEIEGQFVYVIKEYKEEGLAIVIYRDEDEGSVYLAIGDFDGNPINVTNESHPLQWAALDFATHDSSKIVAMMKTAKIKKMILYISVGDDGDLRLVDLRTSLNKFYGPGMIRDLFGKIYPTQEVIKTIALDEDTLRAIKRGEGSYKGNLIFKCSKFKTVVRGKEMLPLYAKIERS